MMNPIHTINDKKIKSIMTQIRELNFEEQGLLSQKYKTYLSQRYIVGVK